MPDNPADELRFQYDLPPGANILDVGGYNGDFAARFIELCNANVTIFEPASVFASKIKSRFAGEKRVRIHEAGLSDKDEIVDFYINADASSVFGAANDPGTNGTVVIRLVGGLAYKNLAASTASARRRCTGSRKALS